MSGRLPFITLLIIGADGVGKTALAKRLCPQEFTYDPTLGDSCSAMVAVDGWTCMVDILTTSGMEEYTALYENFIRDASAFILAYSVTSRTSFSDIQAHDNWIKKIKEEMRVAGPPTTYPSYPLYNSVVILVGTKNDLEAQREVSVEEGQMLAKSLNCSFFETSAKQNTDVEKALHDILRGFRQKNFPTPSEPETPTPSRSRKGLGRLLGPRQRKNDNGSGCVVM
ncbi:hypothetical protein N7517_008258 [Penicillium concentricum]|uniref:Uncharacterized protein n=1 Tax=Penicillium concentricum TaxID=293559 RepID=A0A9W9RSC9_9EURO|nr:uncharacterized protein N7517_008258 [Penicillium concentricum]KAJ5365372.1 hypothetical protein N7517_008258 [Penicillium concentricum]